MEVKNAYTTKELAYLIGVAQQNVHARARRESWQSQPRAGRGGGHEWLLSSMPTDTRQDIATAIATAIAQESAASTPRISPEVFTVNTLTDIPEHKRERASARALLVRMAQEFGAASGTPRTVAYEVFAHEYNAVAIAVPEWVRALVRHICRASLCNWEDALCAQGLAALAGKQGQHRKGKGLIDANPSMAKCIIADIVQYYSISAASVLEGLKARFEGQALPSLRQVQRWVSAYRAANAQPLLKIQNPDGWRNKYQSAAGSRSAHIDRINQLWELDSSPTDIILADGSRHTLMGCIDVATRRIKLYLSRTSNAMAVCCLLRNALLDWGKPETAKMDNGADYKSFQVSTVVHDLGIIPEYCTPFSPEQKPHIERAFKTFQHSFVTRLEGFIGHSVADRKAIEGRRSFAERVSKKQGLKASMQVRYTAEEFQAICDTWTRDVYGEEVHSALGQSPNDAAARMQAETTIQRIDERALDLLLAPIARNKGICHVSKKGVRVNKGLYNAAQLGGLEGEDVQVRLDEQDAGYIYVFDLNGLFICRAEDPHLTGVSQRELALARTQHQKAVMKVKVKEAKAIVAEVKPQETAALILNQKARQGAAKRAERAAEMPATAHNDYTNFALDQASLAALACQPDVPTPESAEESVMRKRMEDDWYIHNIPHFEATQDDLASKEAFVTYRSLIERQRTGGKLTPPETRWLMGYQSTTHCAVHIEMFKDFGEAMLEGVRPLSITA
ncbi:MAG: transposase [Desulfovibrionaceae bacterium]